MAQRVPAHIHAWCRKLGHTGARKARTPTQTDTQDNPTSVRGAIAGANAVRVTDDIASIIEYYKQVLTSSNDPLTRKINNIPLSRPQ